MIVTCSPWRDLRRDYVETWHEIRRENPALASPYFHPTFTDIISEACGNVEVAVIGGGGRVIEALFPFQRMPGNIGMPVGSILSDYHGLICVPGFNRAPTEIVRSCKLAAWQFDHLPVAQQCFAPFHRSVARSPQIDLSEGSEAYFQQNKSARGVRMKARRIERDFGPLRFEFSLARSGCLRHADCVERGAI